MHIPNEVNEKLECDLRCIFIVLSGQACFAQAHVTLQSICGVPYAAKHIDIPSTLPASLSWESASLTRVVIRCADVVQGACPPVLRQTTDPVCPGSDRSEMAVPFIIQDVTQDRHDRRMQMHLSDRRDDFMTYETIRLFRHDISPYSPTAPHALTDGIIVDAAARMSDTREKRMVGGVKANRYRM